MYQSHNLDIKLLHNIKINNIYDNTSIKMLYVINVFMIYFRYYRITRKILLLARNLHFLRKLKMESNFAA